MGLVLLGIKKTLKIGFIGGGINSAVGNTHRIASHMDGRWILEAGCFSKRHGEGMEISNTGLVRSGIWVDGLFQFVP